MPTDLKKIEKIIELLHNTDVTELELEEEGVRIRVCRGNTPSTIHHQGPITETVISVPSPAPAAPPAPAKTEEPSVHQHIVRSPMVGTFYISPAPSSPAFVEIGKKVKAGDVLCIVEAMKMMNQIESDKDGTVIARLVDSGMPVEFDQPLFVIE